VEDHDGLGSCGEFSPDEFCGRVEGALVNVAKNGFGSPVGHSISSADKADRGKDYLVSEADAQVLQDLKKGFRATSRGCQITVTDAEVIRKGVLELTRDLPPTCPVRQDYFPKGFNLLLAQGRLKYVDHHCT
jgi:hypothetical protein